jgi:glycerate dehydrogenase
VLSNEPPTGDDPLLSYAGDNLLLTPHIAWAGAQSRQRAIDALAENARAFMEGRRLNRVV